MNLRAFALLVADAVFPRPCAACGAARTGVAYCAPCLEALPRAPAGAPGAFVYGGPVADAIRNAKFHRDTGAARALAEHAREALLAEGTQGPASVDAVVAVPAHWRRRVARGFDLPAVFADALARQLAVPVHDALVCTRLDAPLSAGADKDTRARTVRDRYRVTRAVRGMRLLVVDDVHTTGATLGEVCRVLEGAGAAPMPWAYAFAP